MGSFFGGKQGGSSSVNVNNGMLTSALSPAVNAGGQAGGLLGQLLGGGFNQFKKDAGFDWASQQGANGIMGSAAARGLLRSGSTGKALMNYGNNQANTFYGGYLDKLLGLGQLGAQTGGVLANAGQTSKETKGKPGLGGIIGAKLLGG